MSASLSRLARGGPAPRLQSQRERLSEKSALVLRVLRQKARASRNKKPKAFYSIRKVATQFGVPATTVSRIFTQLKAEGLLTTVWGSRTFIAPAELNNALRVRGIIALPASLTAFCALRQYRDFFSGVRELLWNSGFATQLLFYEESNAETPAFAERLLRHRPDVVIWFLPRLKFKETVARLLDRGTRVITVADSPHDSREHLYYVDRQPAIKDALSNWQKNGIRSVTVLQRSQCRSSEQSKMLQHCLQEAVMPYAFATPESVDLEEAVTARSEQPSKGVILASSEVAVPFVTQNPARFARLLQQSRILVLDGLIDVPGLCESLGSCDVVEIDPEPIAKRIATDLVQSIRVQQIQSPVFRAKWIPAGGVAGSNRCNPYATTRNRHLQ